MRKRTTVAAMTPMMTEGNRTGPIAVILATRKKTKGNGARRSATATVTAIARGTGTVLDEVDTKTTMSRASPRPLSRTVLNTARMSAIVRRSGRRTVTGRGRGSPSL